MVNINWFPGHMHKARKEIAAVMGKVQLVVEVVDARTPFSSENPLVNPLRGKTPCLKVLNKSDLADPARTKQWINEFNSQSGVRAIALDAKEAASAKAVLQAAEETLSVTPDRMATMLVLGIPNVGKSTLINTLAGRQVCKTGDVPAVTRQQQLIVLTKRINLLDTPGFLWPKLAPATCAERLAMTGAIKESAFDSEQIAASAARLLLNLYPEVLAEAYNFERSAEDAAREEDEAVEFVPGSWDPVAESVLAAVATKRCLLERGGVPDLARASAMLLNDLRKGKLGRLTLETPEMIEREGGHAGKIEGIKGAEGRHERKQEKKRERKEARAAKKRLGWSLDELV